MGLVHAEVLALELQVLLVLLVYRDFLKNPVGLGLLRVDVVVEVFHQSGILDSELLHHQVAEQLLNRLLLPLTGLPIVEEPNHRNMRALKHLD